MVSVLQRMRALRTLLAIRLGPGAAILPPEVTRIHLDFAFRINGGHRGARHFWRQFLPRLKYHNPGVPMTVTRHEAFSSPATLTIHYTSALHLPSKAAISSTTTPLTSSAPVPQSTPIAATVTTEVINMKDKPEAEILAKLMEITKAKTVRPTEEEKRMIKDMEEHQTRTDKDRAVQAVETARKKREKAMLAKAQGEVDALIKNM
ncbi:50S ribosomal protein-like protein Mrp49 [Calycina marina]|uniref:50S ribosomal protein-like protein Mrp49 n=1 Tax=Calycina marina TaxID=1763456 RepID=A0A9P8CID2_9HELO|nr:50S ribosomal protein-like protein Mrp49 [Calycina marina]